MRREPDQHRCAAQFSSASYHRRLWIVIAAHMDGARMDFCRMILPTVSMKPAHTLLYAGHMRSTLQILLRLCRSITGITVIHRLCCIYCSTESHDDP